MDRNEIEGALHELTEELDRRCIVARIHLVGGAGIVSAFQDTSSGSSLSLAG